MWPIVGGGPPHAQQAAPGTGMYVAQGVTDGEAAREIDRQHEQRRQASLEVRKRMSFASSPSS